MLPNHLSELFAGKRNITAIIAFNLENALGIEAEFWLRLQNRYDLTIIRIQREKAQKSYKAPAHPGC